MQELTQPGPDRPVSPGPSQRPLRADAARNRQLILRAAAEVFATHGEAVDVREIASRAGVGMGTLYRHFPTKEELLNTILHLDFTEWTAAARLAAEQEPDPVVALVNFLRDALERQSHHRALAEGFADCWNEAGVTVCRQELHPILDDLTHRCHEAGALRAGVGPEDISVLLTGLGTIVQLARSSGRPELPTRALDVVLAGLLTPEA